MGTVYADIVLKNAWDVANALRELTPDAEVREVAVRSLVDTGAGTLVISEEVRERLGLKIRGLREVTLANEKKEISRVTEPVEIHWKNRTTDCPALVVSGWGTVLLGAIPLEDMDLMVDPVRQELAGAHGEEPLSLVMYHRYAS